MEKQNANPTVYVVQENSRGDGGSKGKNLGNFPICISDFLVDGSDPSTDWDDGAEEKTSADAFDALEVFQMIRHLNDPEHPLTLEQLNVASVDNIEVDDKKSIVNVKFTPTIPHCSMATLIGLSIRVKLLRSLPRRFKVKVPVDISDDNLQTVFCTPLKSLESEAVSMILAKWKQFQTQERDLDFVVVSTDLGDGGSCMATIPFLYRDSVSHISVVKAICHINQLSKHN